MAVQTYRAPTGADRAARRSPSHAPERDLRLDFMRGACLLFMLWNHVFWVAGQNMPFFLQFTPLHWGLANAAVGFVFVSGLVFGAVYNRLLHRDGATRVFARIGIRVWQLYVANLLAMCLTLAAISYLSIPEAGAWERLVAKLSLETLAVPGARAFLDLVTLRSIPWGFDVLPLYMLLLPLGTIYLLLLRRSVLLVLAVALPLYALGQAGINIRGLKAGHDVWFFNPFAWQLLFAIGLVIGTGALRIHRDRALTAVAAAIVGAVAIVVWLLPKLARLMPDSSMLAGFQPVEFPLAGITNLEPVRLLYFMILAFLIASLTNASDRIWSAHIARPVIVLGQHSLEVYCFVQFFTYATGVVLIAIGAGWIVCALTALGGWAMCVLFALIVRARKAVH
jgi:hypothetical protein